MTDNTQGLEDILDTLTEKSADSDSRLGYVDAYVFAQEAKQALLAWRDIAIAEARESTRKLYDKELKMHRDFMTNVLARENLKTDKTMSICDVCLTQLIFPKR